MHTNEYWNFGTACTGQAQFSMGVCCAEVSLADTTMPKIGPSPLKCLWTYVRGNTPPLQAKTLIKGQGATQILKPRHGKPAGTNDPYGKLLVCKCGYHKAFMVKIKIDAMLFVLTQVSKPIAVVAHHLLSQNSTCSRPFHLWKSRDQPLLISYYHLYPSSTPCFQPPHSP